MRSWVVLTFSNCAPASALTETDIAYLKELYRMGADRNVNLQRDQIAYGMQQDLEGK